MSDETFPPVQDPDPEVPEAPTPPEPEPEPVSAAGSGMKTTNSEKRAYNKKPRPADGEPGRDWLVHEKCGGVGCNGCNGGLVPPR